MQTYKDYTDILNNTGTYILKQYSYDVLDRVITMEYFNSTNLSNAVESYAYTYDKNSNITSEKISYHYANNEYIEQKEYRYDSLGQLVENKVSKNTEEPVITTYTYDNVGNRISMTVGKETTTYTYNPLNQLISSITVAGTTSQETSNVSYTYDLNGNQIRQRDTVIGKITEYEYNIDGQLTLVSEQKNGEVIFTQENSYNGDGQRIQKIDNGQVTNYYYQDAGLLYTTDASNKLCSFYYEGISNNVMAITTYIGDKATYYVYNKDIHGSITNLIDGNGESVKGYSYNDFGTSISFGDSSVKNELTYTGAVYDEITGLYYLNARYYDSSTGRFLSQDSVRGNAKDENTWNLYTYCANDPINYVDPSGHFWETLWDILGGADSFSEFCEDPSWENAGYAIVDTVAIFVPFVPGTNAARKAEQKAAKYISKSAAKKAARIVAKNMVPNVLRAGVKGYGRLSVAADYCIRSYSALKRLTKGTGLQVHHIIEKRLAKRLGIKNTNSMLSVAVTKAEHRKFTKQWRDAIPYGTNYAQLKPEKIWAIAKDIYRGYPELLHAASKTIFR